MTRKSDNKNGMRKVLHLPLGVKSSEKPHPMPKKKKNGRQRYGPTDDEVVIGAFYRYERGEKGSIFKYLLAKLGEMLTEQNSVTTVAGWTEWDDFRNEETRTDFIIKALTTQEKWRQRGRTVHMGWHIPDILYILYSQGYCDAKQIEKILNAFKKKDSWGKVPGWSETTKELKGNLPDVLYKISVDGPVKFDMEFASYTDNGKEKCYIGNAAFGDRPSLMQWFKGKDGNPIVDSKPVWQRCMPHKSAAPEGYTMSPSETKKSNREKTKENKKHVPRIRVEKKSRDDVVDERMSALLAGKKVTNG